MSGQNVWATVKTGRNFVFTGVLFYYLGSLPNTSATQQVKACEFLRGVCWSDFFPSKPNNLSFWLLSISLFRGNHIRLFLLFCYILFYDSNQLFLKQQSNIWFSPKQDTKKPDLPKFTIYKIFSKITHLFHLKICVLFVQIG